MKVNFQKIRVTGLKSNYKIFMQELHRWGILEISNNTNFIEKSNKEVTEHFGVFNLSRIDFAINFLKPYATKGKKMDSFLSGGKIILSEDSSKDRLKSFSGIAEKIVKDCELGEETLVKNSNEIEKLTERIETILNYQNLNLPLAKDFSTERTQTFVGMIVINKKEALLNALAADSNLVDIDVLSESEIKRKVYLRITAENSLVKSTKQILTDLGFENIDFSMEFNDSLGQSPEDVLAFLTKHKASLEKEIEEVKQNLTKNAEHIDDLKILFDYNQWKKKKNDIQESIFQSENLFAFEGWIEVEKYEELEKWVNNSFVGDVIMEKAEKNKGETEPVLNKNNIFVRAFEPLVEMFGLPGEKELDPTPLVAPFFFVFFGVCLSDVAYGLILMLASSYFLIFGKFSRAAKDGIRLLFFCGLAALLGGVALGGYAGLTVEQLPQWVNKDTGIFYGQFFDTMTGSGPIIFLITTFALGILHLMSGELSGGIQQLKQGRYIQAFGAYFSTVFLLLAAIFMVLTMTVPSLESMAVISGIVIKVALLGLFVGKGMTGGEGKGILSKLVSGLLGLYDTAVSYLSNVLSYSRLMALGLATGIVGFSMNLTAGILSGMMPHWTLGLIVSIIIIAMGHTLNIVLSMLSAFIHSGRLQFIEFFGRFYEGGGRKFAPFARKTKYLAIRNDKK